MNYSKLAASFLMIFGFSIAAYADNEIDSQSFGSENITEPARQTPFNFDTKVDFIGNTQINKGFYKGDTFRFAQADIELGGVFYYVPEYTEGANLSLSYSETYISWHNNPWFDQEHFRIVSLALGAFTKRIDDWFWRGQVSANFDTKKFDPEYISYDVLFWGRYTYREDIGIHFGFYVQTGMQMDRVYPVFGADWVISPKWKLNLIYPMNISLEYHFTKVWSLSLAGRTFSSRYRIAPGEGHAKSLIRYQNTGLELMVKYETQYLSANIHAGSTLGGDFRVANKNNHHPHHYHLDSSGYIGGEIEVTF